MFDLRTMIPLDGFRVFRAARALTPNIAFYVPRNVNVDQLSALADDGERVEVEQNVLNGKSKTVTAYYGQLVNDVEDV